MPTIETFHGDLMAFFRPIKKSYFILKWNTDLLQWRKFEEDLPNLTIHRSNLTAATAYINIQPSRGFQPNRIQISAEGYFLKSADRIVTIVRKISGNIPPTLMKKSYEETHNANTYQEQRNLWIIKPPEAPKKPVMKPIPERIAWLIAEDSCKKNESCPISMEPISPLTAAVTTCFHVFDTLAINEWLARNQNAPCPVCRETFAITLAFRT